VAGKASEQGKPAITDLCAPTSVHRPL